MRGGKREGSGRPGKYQGLKTKAMKLPAIFEDQLKEYAEKLSIEHAIKTVCTLNSKPNTRIYLSNLRSKLDIDREKLNSILLDLSDRGILSLYMLENPLEVTAGIEAGSFQARGETFHIVYLLK